MKNRFLRGATALLLLCWLPSPGRAQSVGIGTATPDAKAALDIRAADKGLLIPRLTAAQRTAISAPPQGLMVYQTDGTSGGGPQTGFWYYGGAPAAWVFINPAGGGADNLGNHTATQPLNLQANALTGTGASVGTAVGVGVRADGGLNLGQNGVGNNLYLGYQAGQATIARAGQDNLFVGYQAGAANTTGLNNQFTGYQSGKANTTGSFNVFSGYQSGYSNTTGSYNVFGGTGSGQANTTGSYNLFSGYRSGFYNTTGNYNQFNGYGSGFANETGSNNVFSGYESGFFNLTGLNNQFTGYQSGYNNATGSNNVFSGYQSGFSNLRGGDNVFSGYQAGYNNTTGGDNIFSGYQSGYLNTTGIFNLFSGYRSGYSNTTGSKNLALGYLAGPNSSNLTNASAIGYQAQVSTSNSLVLGGLGPDAVNVGIGTSSPSQRLEVNGNIMATGTVNMGWTQLSGTYNLSGHILDSYTLTCPSGMRVLGGGGGHRDNNIAASEIIVNYSGPDPADPEHAWRVIVGNNANNARAIRVYCNCARIAP